MAREAGSRRIRRAAGMSHLSPFDKVIVLVALRVTFHRPQPLCQRPLQLIDPGPSHRRNSVKLQFAPLRIGFSPSPLPKLANS